MSDVLSRQLNTRLPEDLIRRLDRMADRMVVSRSVLMRKALERLLDELEEGETFDSDAFDAEILREREMRRG